MKCPRCESTTLTEREREGIVVDSCAQCRGIWLDRGELEKLITRATNDLDGSDRRSDPPPPRPSHQHSDRPHRHQDDDHRRYPRKKRHWMESLSDIFD